VKVTFILDQEDVWQLTRYVYRSDRRYRRQMISLVVYLPALLLLFMWLSLHRFWLSLAVAALFSGILLPLIYWKVKRDVMRTAAKRPGVLGEHTIEIDAEGVRERTAVNDTFTSWKGVHNIVDDKKHIYLFVAENMAHVVPKRAFASDLDAQAFVELANTCWYRAKVG